MSDLQKKVDDSRALHLPGQPFVLFNIWDPGTARAVTAAGARLPPSLNQRYFVAQGFRCAVEQAKAKEGLNFGRDTVLLQSTMREGTIGFNSTRVGKLRGIAFLVGVVRQPHRDRQPPLPPTLR